MNCYFLTDIFTGRRLSNSPVFYSKDTINEANSLLAKKKAKIRWVNEDAILDGFNLDCT